LAADDKNTVTWLHVRVTPGAHRNETTGFKDGMLNIRIAAPPDKGKANKELISHLSRVLDISKSSLRLLKGHTSRRKVIAVDGLTEPEIIRRISV
jgi:uncharacterized protein (TIGR00251 family)